jgi:hypothetical protein
MSFLCSIDYVYFGHLISRLYLIKSYWWMHCIYNVLVLYLDNDIDVYLLNNYKKYNNNI